ncbi:MAG: class I SAM-dependent methyltransferase [Deltaproteobacteria bacterium]|nr:MAG: class I SAM-dependent methyltransferase [Deltaproteobacteria bacterium]
MRKKSWQTDWRMWKTYLRMCSRSAHDYDPTEVEEFYDWFIQDSAAEIFHGNIHWGYWQNGAKTIEEAADAIVDLLGESAQIGEGEHCLDVGCGIGGPALRLAQRHHCHITGLNISPAQIEKGRQLAEEAREALEACGASVEFVFGDAMKMPFEPETFDHVYALDSMMHMNDKGRFIAEASRVLKPGGKFTILDFSLNFEFTGQERKRIERAQKLWRAPDPISFGELTRFLEANGLEILIEKDLSEDFRQSMEAFEKTFSLLNVLARQRNFMKAIAREYTPLGLLLFKRILDSLIDLKLFANRTDVKMAYFLVTARKRG